MDKVSEAVAYNGMIFDNKGFWHAGNELIQLR